MIAGEQTSAHVLTQRLVVVSETTSLNGNVSIEQTSGKHFRSFMKPVETSRRRVGLFMSMGDARSRDIDSS
jgi:hypothetical protein